MWSQQSHTLAVVLAVLVMAVVMAVVLTVVLAVVLAQIKSTAATSDECMIDARPHTNGLVHGHPNVWLGPIPSPLPPLPQALAMAVTALAGYGLVNSNLQLLVQIGEWG